MWYSRKNLVDEFNNNPEQFLRCFGYMLDFHRPIIIKRSHNGHGGLYWQYDLKPPLVEAQSWGETIDLPEYGDEVIAGPTSDWMAILGGLMKAVNTGSMVDGRRTYRRRNPRHGAQFSTEQKRWIPHTDRRVLVHGSNQSTTRRSLIRHSGLRLTCISRTSTLKCSQQSP